MAGLDTRGLASGFQAGFQMVDQYQRGKRADQRADQQLDMQRQKFDMQKEEVDRARDLETIQLAFGKIASGMEVSDEELETLKRNPRYWSALDPGVDPALAQADRVVDPNDPADINDPESIEALNTVFGADLNKGAGKNKRIAAAVPGPDGESLVFELDVEGEDGNHYRAPITERRSADEDDPVRQVPVDGVIRQVQGLKALRKAMQTPEAQQQASSMLKLLRGETDEGTWEQVEGPGGSILQRNTKTGETKQVIGRAPQSGGGYANRPTSTMKDAQWMVDNGIAANLSEAYEKINQTRTGVDTYGRAQDELEALDSRVEDLQGIKQDPAQWRLLSDEEQNRINSELEEFRSRRDETFNNLYSGGSSGRGLAAPTKSREEKDEPRMPKDEKLKSAPKPEPEARPERGQRPGPSPADDADALLKDILG